MSLFKSKIHLPDEAKASLHIPFTCLHSPTIFETENGMLGSAIKLQGVDFTTLDTEQLATQQANFHHTLMLLDARFSMYVITHRTQKPTQLQACFSQTFAQQLDQAYQQQFNDQPLFVNHIYIVILTRPLTSQKLRLRDLLSGARRQSIFMKQRHHWRHAQVNSLQSAMKQLQASLNDFKLHVLGSHDPQLGYSELLALLGLPLNAGIHYPFAQMTGYSSAHSPFHTNDKITQHYPFGRIGQYLTAHSIEFDQWIRFRNEKKDTLAAIVTIKRYPSISSINMLQAMLNLNCSFIMTQSFAFVDDAYAQRYIQRQLIRLINVNDPAFSQQAALSEARDKLASSQLAMGYHHHTVMLYAKNEEQLKNSVAHTIHSLAKNGMIAIHETIGQESTFWAQLPGNFRYITRASLVSSENFSDFCPLHSCSSGYRHKNHLGEAVTILETSVKTPYFFNYHLQSHDKQPSLGHSLVIGGSYSGKTVFLSFIDAQMSRYKGRTFYFDRDRSAEIYIRASGGTYFILSPDHLQKNCFNPLQLDDTPANRTFLYQWITQLCQLESNQPLGAQAIAMLKRCIDYGYDSLAKKHRSLSNICRLLPINFTHWYQLRCWLQADSQHSCGEYAYLFDHSNDHLQLTDDKIGIDMTHFLDREPATVRCAVMMYLLHRIGLQLDGRLTSILLDEGWQYFDDPHWCTTLKRWLPTLRKYNAHIVIATQSIQSVLDSPLRNMVLDNIATQVIFANPQAQAADYIDGLKLTQREYELIRDQNLMARYFLVKQHQQATLCHLNLQQLPEWLPILSTNRHSIDLLDHIRKQVGDDPKHWLPLLKQQLKSEH